MKKSERKTRPGPAGSLIVAPGYRLRGAPRGTARKRSPKQQDALARGRHLTKTARTAIAETRQRDAAENEAAHLAALDGDFRPLGVIQAKRASRASTLLLDGALDAVEKDGVVLTEEAVDSDGRVIASKKRINPAAELALKAGEVFGISADAQLATPKARGVSRKDDALAAYLAGQRALNDSLALNPPAREVDDDVIDSEVVEEPAEADELEETEPDEPEAA